MTAAEAQKRLQGAFDRLETAMRKLADPAVASAEIAKLRRDNAELERAAESASARLDATITRLGGTLEG